MGAVEAAYREARDRYAVIGVSTDEALERLSGRSISLPCWQLDDLTGFESAVAGGPGGGLMVTGGAQGRAGSPAQVRAGLEAAMALVPGRHRVNLHAMYGSHASRCADRDAIEPGDFSEWISWAMEKGVPLDFNPTLFSHRLARSGWTLSSTDPATRAFWIEHVRRCRIAAGSIGAAQGTPCTCNLWIPDGSREAPSSPSTRRGLLIEALDEIYSSRVEPVRDSLESKLFGIGVESFTSGSHELYLAYAVRKGLMPCLDMGHFHPTESVADKITSILPFVPGILLHVSRGVRWDSDHVPAPGDALRSLAREVARCDDPGRLHVALDFFDGSWNRVGALAAGARAFQLALLEALLEPRGPDEEDPFEAAAAAEHLATLPLGAVWDMFLEMHGVPGWPRWVREAGRSMH